MHSHRTPKTRTRSVNPLAKLDLRIVLSEEEILADLRYPANGRRPGGRR